MRYVLVLLSFLNSAYTCQLHFEVPSWKNLSQTQRDGLLALTKEAGWYEEGGWLFYDQTKGKLNRSKWIPNSEWWTERPYWIRANGEKIYKLTEEQLNTLIMNYQAGKILTNVEREMIDFMLELNKEYLEQNEASIDSLVDSHLLPLPVDEEIPF